MATLTVTITESVSLGDGSTDRGTTNTQTLTVTEVDHRIMDVTTAEVQILKFASLAAAGTFKDGDVKYLRLTNLSSTNFITLRIQMSDSEYFVKLESEGSDEGANSFILGPTMMDAHEDGDTSVGTAPTLANIDAISADADTATCQLEYFVASA